MSAQPSSKPKTVKVPGPEHPIVIEPHGKRVRVTVGGTVIAETAAALRMQEAAYAPVFYIPRSDANLALLERTDHVSYCPYKGDCNYFSIPAGGERATNAVWTYEAPFPAVAAIKDHLAFYAERVDAIEEIA